jgi:prevent-host-death family protein
MLIGDTKSDNLIFMIKKMTATEVSRNFSEVLKMVESGEEVVITRGKKTIAVISPKSQTSGERLAELLSTSGSVFDDELVRIIEDAKIAISDPELNRTRV